MTQDSISKQVIRCCINFSHELTCQILTNQTLKVGRRVWPRWGKSKATAFRACNSRLIFRIRGQFEIKILMVRLINTTYFLCILKKWTWACDHLKTSNLSADNFQKILDLDGSIPESAIRSGDIGQRISWIDICHMEVQYQVEPGLPN